MILSTWRAALRPRGPFAEPYVAQGEFALDGDEFDEAGGGTLNGSKKKKGLFK